MDISDLKIDQNEEQAFQKALLGEDDLGAVVRAHIYIESKLILWLESAVINTQALNAMKLDYGRRVHLAVALGLDPELARPLKTLGKIRNEFAHQPDCKLTEQSVDGLFSSCGMNERGVVLRGLKRTSERVDSTLPPEFSHLSPKDKFALIAIVLRSAMIIAQHEVEQVLNE